MTSKTLRSSHSTWTRAGVRAQNCSKWDPTSDAGPLIICLYDLCIVYIYVCVWILYHMIYNVLYILIHVNTIQSHSFLHSFFADSRIFLVDNCVKRETSWNIPPSIDQWNNAQTRCKSPTPQRSPGNPSRSLSLRRWRAISQRPALALKQKNGLVACENYNSMDWFKGKFTGKPHI